MAEDQRRRASCACDHPCFCLCPTRGTLSSRANPWNHPNGRNVWNRRCRSDGNLGTSESRWNYGSSFGSPANLAIRLSEGVGIYHCYRDEGSRRRFGMPYDLPLEGG